MSRDRLICLLWPEADAENGRRFLSDSVYRINRTLGPDLILATGDELRLDTQRLPTDLAEFDDALKNGDHARAVAVYGGPFLDAFFLSGAREFEEWVDLERDRRAREHVRALEALAVADEERGDHLSAVTRWRTIAALDPTNSRIALRLMRALDAAGERAAAIQHARVHSTLLETDMGIAADADVAAFAESLRTAVGRSGRRTTDDERQTTGGEKTAIVVDTAQDVGTGQRRRGPAARWIGPVAAGMVALVLWMAVLSAARGNEVGLRSVAVLPFVNLSASHDDEYFSDGITEELITRLSKVEGITVASRTSAFAFKNRAADVRDVGRTLGVAAVLEGSVRRSGEKLRITVRLVNATTGRPVWSEEYERRMADVLVLEEELSRVIVAKLTGALFEGANADLVDHPIRDAGGAAQSAIRIDPTLGAPYATLAPP